MILENDKEYLAEEKSIYFDVSISLEKLLNSSSPIFYESCSKSSHKVI